MNRIDRISAILIQLQSRPLVRAVDIAERFGVSIRTIYRDIQTLYEAGVPICGDSGVGYSLVEGYRLPPLMFTREEALAFVTAGKLVEQLTDEHSNSHFVSGLDKIRAVLRGADKSDLADLDSNIEVYRNKALSPPKLPNLIQVVLGSISTQLAMQMRYFTPSRNGYSDRLVEAVGVSYGYPHWYLTAFCHLRKEYRHFRLDRVEAINITTMPFSKHHPPLKELLHNSESASSLLRVVLHTTKDTSALMGEQKQYLGLVQEKELENGLLEQVYMSYSLNVMMRWLLAYADTISIVEPTLLKEMLMDKLRQIIDQMQLDRNTD